MNLILPFVVILASSAWAAPGPIPFRPVPSAGTNSRTLVAYGQEHAAYSLANSLTLLKLQLGRIDTELETIPFDKLNSNALRRCQYLVVLAADSPSQVTSNVVMAIDAAMIPVLWVGTAVEALESISDIRSQVRFDADLTTGHKILFRDKEWDVGPFAYRPAEFRGQVDSPLVGVPGPKSQVTPLGWRSGRFTFFPSPPQSGALGFVFEEMLLDFYQVKEVATNCILLRIGGYHRGSNHRQVRRMADYLFSRSIPFALSVRGFTEQLTNSENSAFVSTLRYAQQRGGRLVMQGTAASDRTAEFWDFGADKGHSEPTGGLPVRMASGLRAAFAVGLLPVAWETPQFAAAQLIYREAGSIFSTAIERVQLSDATGRDNYGPAGLSRDESGRQILPDNSGYLSDSTNAVPRVEQVAELLAGLRGTIISSSFDSYLPLERLIELVAVLEHYHLPFLDLADFSNRVQLSDNLLLTGTASGSRDLKDTTIRWKTYNRAGDLLAEDEQKTKASGRREFKRIGIGIFELVQFRNGSTK